MNFETWKYQVSVLSESLGFTLPSEEEMEIVYNSGVKVSEFTRIEAGKWFEERM